MLLEELCQGFIVYNISIYTNLYVFSKLLVRIMIQNLLDLKEFVDLIAK